METGGRVPSPYGKGRAGGGEQRAGRGEESKQTRPGRVQELRIGLGARGRTG